MMPKRINIHILFTVICLIAVIIFFEFTSLDLYVENYFYQMNTHTWILNRNDAFTKFIFYIEIKKILIFFAIATLFSLIFFRKNEFIKKHKKGLMIFLLSSMVVPLAIGSLKYITDTPCPKNLKYYGGTYPDVKVLESYPKDFIHKNRVKCWPAGHASGGFALMALFFLFNKRKNKIIALGFGLFIGWSMGLYKMLIGDHFLSHTIVTMLLAWLIILIIAKIFQRKKDEKSTQI